MLHATHLLTRRPTRRLIQKLQLVHPIRLAPEPRQQHASLIDHKQTIAITRIHQINLLQRTAARFRQHEIDDQGEEGIQDEKDHVCLPADVGNGHGRDLHNHVVEDPVAGGGDGGGCSWDESDFNHAQHRRRRLSSFTSNAGYSASARRTSREGSNRSLITGEKDSRIFQFYIENAGPWLDIVSPARHFGQTVPRLALTEPVLFYACLAYASHVMSLMEKVDKASEETYQSQAIGLLIPLLDSREQPWTDEVLLATAVILRMSEQFSEVAEDAQHHLNGAFSLFGTSGQKWSPFNTGLRGIAFWIYLRESIRVCFLFEQACRFDMSLIEDYAFEQAPDEVWSNRMTYLLARTCNACWGSAVVDGEGEMARLNSAIDAWKRGLPSTFLPWSTCAGDGPFPTIRVLSTWHLIGWQQYYAAKVMLAVHSKLAYPAGSFLDHNRYMQREVLEPARHLCGLCFSCDDIGSAINGSHLTAWCGQFLTGADEQRTLVSELDALMEKTTWPNKTCSRKLRRIWKGEQQGWADTG